MHSDEPSLGDSIMGLARLAEFALADERTSLTPYRVLRHLRQGRSIQSDLAFQLAVTKQSVTRLVDALVAKDYVTRRTDDICVVPRTSTSRLLKNSLALGW